MLRVDLAMSCGTAHSVGMTTTTTSSPAEIDTELARIWSRQQQLSAWIADTTRFIAKERFEGNRADLARSLANYEAEHAALTAEAAPLAAQYNARRWSRFFLVTNTNGHVHSSLNCGTCYARTTYAWLPELSDRTEAEAVTEFGEKMCTVCFPSAPANPAFHTPGRRDAEAIAERQAAKDAREAKKAAKSLVPGTEFRCAMGYRVTTLAAAKAALRDAHEAHGVLKATGRSWATAEAIETVVLAAEAALRAKGLTGDDLAKLAAQGLKKASWS